MQASSSYDYNAYAICYCCSCWHISKIFSVRAHCKPVRGTALKLRLAWRRAYKLTTFFFVYFFFGYFDGIMLRSCSLATLRAIMPLSVCVSIALLLVQSFYDFVAESFHSLTISQLESNYAVLEYVDCGACVFGCTAICI